MQMNKHGLYDIYGIWHVPFWKTKIFYITLFSIFLVFGSIFFGYIIYLLKNRRKKRIPAWEVALNQLQQLQNKTNPESSKLFYTTLTNVLKCYLQDRYGLDLQSKTDYEVIKELEQAEFSPALLHDVETILNGAIESKFAQNKALKEQLQRHLDLSKDLIKSTIPKESHS